MARAAWEVRCYRGVVRVSTAFDVEGFSRSVPLGVMCRVSVRAASTEVDLALPTAVPLDVLITSIIDIVSSHSEEHVLLGTDARDWQLCRPGAEPLSSSTTLGDSRIRDGDLLLLMSADGHAAAPLFKDDFQIVASSTDTTRPWTGQAARITAATAFVWAAGWCALILLRSAATDTAPDRAIPAVGVAFAAVFAVAVVRRALDDSLSTVAMSVAATGFVTVAGFLVVPGGPGAPNVLLGSAACSVAAILIMRLVACGTICLTALAAFSLTLCAVATGVVASSAPANVAGAVLTTVSLCLLSAGPRLSMVMARLSPAMRESDDTAEPASDIDARAAHGHATLTGLVIGFCVSAAVGMVLTVVRLRPDEGPPVSGAAFTVVVSLVLMLRAHSHRDMLQGASLLGAGIVSLTSAFVVVAWSPGLCSWMSGIGAMAAAVALWFGFSGVKASPVARRAVEILEYLALAAVVPLACWVCGLFTAVLGLHLT
jgi:type VII secretion integral membrane protein EccD